MKIECPYCYQHYEIEESDMDRELVCVNCEQSFRVCDALVLDQKPAHRQPMTWLLIVIGVLTVLLLVFELWNWRKLGELRTAIASGDPAVAAAAELPKKDEVSGAAKDLQKALHQEIGPLERKLAELRAENERLTKQAAELSARLAETEKRLAGRAKPSAAADRTPAGKSEDLAARVKLLEEYHTQLLKGLTDLRSEIQSLNIGDRITARAKKGGAGNP